MGDHYVKPRAAGYHNSLLTGTNDQFLKLVRKYSMHPAANAGDTGATLMQAGGQGPDLIPMLGQGVSPTMAAFHSTRTDDVRLAQVQGNRLVANVNLELAPRGALGNEGGDCIQVKATYIPTQGYVPAYFLPWDDRGAAVRITIPQMQANPTDPNVFFTAAINGCSVFFNGTAQNPTITHCGGDTGLPQDLLGERARFWEEVMALLEQADVAAGRPNLGAPQRSINLTDYIKEAGEVSTRQFPDAVFADGSVHPVPPMTTLTTGRARRYLANLKALDSTKTSLRFEASMPWGCVLGRRENTTGDWTFYLQENTTIIYHQVQRKLGNPFKLANTTDRYISRPLHYRQIFPAGTGRYCIPAPIPKIL